MHIQYDTCTHLSQQDPMFVYVGDALDKKACDNAIQDDRWGGGRKEEEGAPRSTLGWGRKSQGLFE